MFKIMHFLSEQEKALLKAQHKKERDKRICDRIKAILLYDDGWSPKDIAKVLLITDEAVRNHINEYLDSQKLKPESGGSVEKLSAEQSALLEVHLLQYTYLYVKDIAAYVKATFAITYTVAGLRGWLKKHKFSYKKPALVPGKADKEKQREWIEAYEKLKAHLSEEETIGFIDGVHPTHNVQLAHGWIKKGIRKEIPANTGRARLNLSGMIDITNHNVVVQEDIMLNAEATITFFQKIEAAYPNKNKIHLFSDNARYYRNKQVLEYLKTSKINLHFLPPYSPNLNPIERLWKWMKERVLYNIYYDAYENFKEAVMGFFSALKNLPSDSELGQNFRSRVGDRFSPIGAPSTNF
jgi:transposase